MTNLLCPNCRKPLSENARFCVECGSRIDFGMTRKELGDDSLKVDEGLKINRNETVTSPFCEKYNNLKEKIINPELAPLPEKKRFVFKNWDEIKNNVIEPESEKLVDEEHVTKNLTEIAVGKSNDEKVIDTLVEVEENKLEKTEECNTNASENPEKSLAEEKVEETVEIEEEAIDFETLKGLFSEVEEPVDKKNEEPELKEKQVEVTAEELPDTSIEIEESKQEEQGEFEEKKENGSNEIENREERIEETADFEGLKNWFSEKEGLILKENLAEVEEKAEEELLDMPAEIEESKLENSDEFEEKEESGSNEPENQEEGLERGKEELVEIEEETGDFETLKGLFSEAEEPVDKKNEELELKEKPVEVTAEELPDTPIEIEETADFEAVKNRFSEKEGLILKENPAEVSDEEKAEEELPDIPAEIEGSKIEKSDEVEEKEESGRNEAEDREESLEGEKEESVEIEEGAGNFATLKGLFLEAEELVDKKNEELELKEKQVEVTTEELSDMSIEIEESKQEEQGEFEEKQENGSNKIENRERSLEERAEETVDIIAEEELPDTSIQIGENKKEEQGEFKEKQEGESNEIENREENLEEEKVEETANFGALKNLFSEREESGDKEKEETILKENLAEVTDKEKEEEELPDTPVEIEGSKLEKPVEVEEKEVSGSNETENREESLEKEKVEELVKLEEETEGIENITNASILARVKEQRREYDTETFINHLSEKICDQVSPDNEVSGESTCNNANRIITSTLGGGFKKKEPQAEEMKDVWKFLSRSLRRGDK